MVITLIGFMGSGKSSIGRILAKRMKMRLIDLDDYIVKKEKMPINEIFKFKGEDYFRSLETKYLKKLLSKYKDAIIPLGGGTPCQEKNWKYISNTKSVYLKKSNEFLFANLKNKKEKRPIIKYLSDDQLKELIDSKMSIRAPFYEKANLIIDMDLSKKELAKIIEAAINVD